MIDFLYKHNSHALLQLNGWHICTQENHHSNTVSIFNCSSKLKISLRSTITFCSPSILHLVAVNTVMIIKPCSTLKFAKYDLQILKPCSGLVYMIKVLDGLKNYLIDWLLLGYKLACAFVKWFLIVTFCEDYCYDTFSHL